MRFRGTIPLLLTMDSILDWFLNARISGASLPDVAKFTGLLIAGYVLAKILKNPIARWVEGIAPDHSKANSLRIARSIEVAIILLISGIVLQSGALDLLRLSERAWRNGQTCVILLLAL